MWKHDSKAIRSRLPFEVIARSVVWNLATATLKRAHSPNFDCVLGEHARVCRNKHTKNKIDLKILLKI